MKKIFLTIAIGCGVWAGSQTLQMNSAAAQSGFGRILNSLTNFAPRTNGLNFTNTLVPPTNAPNLQLSNVVDLLLTLQTNVEETIPALNIIESNAAVAAEATSSNRFSSLGRFGHIVSNPASLLTPTGAASGRGGPPNNSISIQIGTNSFELDPATLQAVTELRDNLERTLPVLQELNGTTPTPTNNFAGERTFFNPPVTGFSPSVTNNPVSPLTNSMPSAF